MGNAKQQRYKRAFKAEQEQKALDFQKRKQEFNIEASWLESMYGRRFVGKLKISDREIAPYMDLEQAPISRLKIARKNQQGMNEGEFKKMGFDVRLPKQPGLLYHLVLFIPGWLDFFVGRFIKAQMMKHYREICIRKRMLYFTYFGDQGGAMVAGMDTREMAPQEYEGFVALYEKETGKRVPRETSGEGEEREGGDGGKEEGSLQQKDEGADNGGDQEEPRS